MPRYRVTFGEPVQYQTGHPRGQCVLTELAVRAPSVAQARAHAMRVTTGFTTLRVDEVDSTGAVLALGVDDAEA